MGVADQIKAGSLQQGMGAGIHPDVVMRVENDAGRIAMRPFDTDSLRYGQHCRASLVCFDDSQDCRLSVDRIIELWVKLDWVLSQQYIGILLTCVKPGIGVSWLMAINSLSRNMFSGVQGLCFLQISHSK